MNKLQITKENINSLSIQHTEGIKISKEWIARNKSTTLKGCTSEQFFILVEKICVLLGIKKPPQGVHFDVLYETLKTHKGNYTLDEIGLAVTLFVTNKLKIDKSKIKHYGTLSIDFISDILTSYTEYLVDINAVLTPLEENTEPTREEKINKRKIFYSDAIDVLCDELTTLIVNHSTIYYYDVLKFIGEISVKKEKGWELYKKMRQRIIDNTNRITDHKERSDYKLFKDDIKHKNNLYAIKCRQECKIYFLKNWVEVNKTKDKEELKIKLLKQLDEKTNC